MEEFVHFQNIARFVEALAVEVDRARRRQIEELLFEELNRQGSRRDRLHEAEQLIIGGGERIRQQRELVLQIMSRGEDASAAKLRLFNLVRSQSVFKACRARLVHGSDPHPTHCL